MNVKRRSPPAPHIPFISLADIAWQIIIFFLMASAFTQTEALQVNFPSSSPQAQAAPDKNVTIVATDSSIKLDGQPITIEALTDAIRAKLKDRTKPEDKVVIVEGNDDLSFQRDSDIMFAVQAAGGTPMVAEGKVAQ